MDQPVGTGLADLPVVALEGAEGALVGKEGGGDLAVGPDARPRVQVLGVGLQVAVEPADRRVVESEHQRRAGEQQHAEGPTRRQPDQALDQRPAPAAGRSGLN